jgi:glycosyltransferase involved in cell wall biosynthesis
VANTKRNGPEPGKRNNKKRITSSHKIENRTRLSVIISVQQDDATIKRVLQQAERLNPKEILVVVNGSHDRSLDIILNHSSYSMTTYVYPFPLGQDVWRAIGAQEATGDVWLFLSGEKVISAEELQPFANACYRGAEVALRKANEFSLSETSEISTLVLARAYLNSLFDRNELGVSSLNDLPFAITQQAAVSIGVHQLHIPPLAHAIALEKGLRIDNSPNIRDEIHVKKSRTALKKRKQSLTSLGDFLEAFSYINEKSRKERT